MRQLGLSLVEFKAGMAENRGPGVLAMAVILLVEDESTNQKIVMAALSNHQVLIAGTLKQAREILQQTEIELLLLDVQLPDGDGFSFFMEIQSQLLKPEVPVVFLTGRMDVTDKVTGFTLGADDYLTKPIHPVEFRARIDGKIRKLQMAKSNSQIFRKDGFVFSMDKQTVSFEEGGQSHALELTTLEFKLLHYLIRHKDHVLSREKLLQDVWGGSLNISDRTIDTHMSHLRKRLVSTNHSIQSVYGAGYRLCRNQKAA